MSSAQEVFAGYCGLSNGTSSFPKASGPPGDSKSSIVLEAAEGTGRADESDSDVLHHCIEPVQRSGTVCAVCRFI